MRLILLGSILVLSLLGCQPRGADSVKALAPAAELASRAVTMSPMRTGAIAEPSERRQIRRSSAWLLVKDVEALAPALRALAQRVGGFIESETIETETHARSVRVVLRVPAEQHEQALAALRELGDVRRVQSAVEEVGDQLLDLRARLATQKALEARLLAHLGADGPAAKDLEALLSLERELARVRMEIERYDAALQGLEGQVALSTLTVDAYEDKEQVALAAEPSFGEEAGLTWVRSWRALRNALEALGLGLVALVPWLPLLAVLSWLIARWLMQGRSGGRRGGATVVTASPSEGA